jgi:hypothetical protein
LGEKLQRKSTESQDTAISTRGVAQATSNSLRNFNAIHIEENCEGISGFHENELFFGCTFKKLNDLTLKNCDLNGSKFLTDDIRDALGFTLTLDCHSADNVEYSPFLFDLILLLLCKTRGNDEKRKKILFEIIGKDRAKSLLNTLSRLE